MNIETKFIIAIVTVLLIFTLAGTYAGQQNRKHTIEMAKLGYTENFIPGSQSKEWVKGE